MDWFLFIRENIWAGILLSSVLTSLVVAFLNLFNKAQEIDNWKLLLAVATVFGISVTDFSMDWSKFDSWQDTLIRLSLTIILPLLVAKVKGQEIIDSLIARVAESAKNVNIGKKE